VFFTGANVIKVVWSFKTSHELYDGTLGQIISYSLNWKDLTKNLELLRSFSDKISCIRFASGHILKCSDITSVNSIRADTSKIYLSHVTMVSCTLVSLHNVLTLSQFHQQLLRRKCYEIL
jgi:hypothetical protein